VQVPQPFLRLAIIDINIVEAKNWRLWGWFAWYQQAMGGDFGAGAKAAIAREGGDN